MNRILQVARAACLPVMLLAIATPVLAQAAAPTASDFYMQYRKAFDLAKKIEDLLPYMSAKTKAQIESTPAADRPEMFGMIKMMGTLTGVKITKTTPTATGATLIVEAVDADKAKTTGTIEIVKEGGAWKLGTESWASK